MHGDPIQKTRPESHNLSDYETARRDFSWTRARAALAGLPGGRGLNIAHEAVDRHVSGRGHVTALRCISAGGATELTFRELSAKTNRFANALDALGVERGDCVFTLAGSLSALYVAVLGALKHRCIVSPLFSAFGPEPIATRMTIGKARVLVTTDRLYRRKVAPIRAQLTDLEHVIVIGTTTKHPLPDDVHDFAALIEKASDDYTIGETKPDDGALLHFTSGTTGTPKGALHVHQAVVAHYHTGRVALDLRQADRYWCTADPGWVTGMSYGIIAPLTCGATIVAYDGPFDIRRWYDVLQQERVTVWYTAPTAVRMCMRAGAELVRKYDLSALRFIASVGEPLNAEVVLWGKEAFGMPIHDNWWQTETGAIMIANLAACTVKPGSMGRPLPGVNAAIVRRDGERIIEMAEAGAQGELAIEVGWPSMFRAYLGEEERYRACFSDGWYLSGDLAKRDDDGFFWFVGRADDVIKSAGHLIGPFEVESALIEHDAVVEAGVIGKPDSVAGNVIKAFVSLKPGVAPTEELRTALLTLTRKRLGAAVAPRELAFEQNLPKTRSGKIMRRLLRARELGLPEGDTSTLEEVTT